MTIGTKGTAGSAADGCEPCSSDAHTAVSQLQLELIPEDRCQNEQQEEHEQRWWLSYMQRGKSCVLWVWELACEHWFLLGMGFAIGFAAAVPDFGRTGGWIRAEWTIRYGAVIVIFLLSGMGLKTRVLATALTRLPLHLLIQLISLGVTPLVGFGVGSGLMTSSVSKDLSSGIIICASMPTTVSTNVVFTRDAGGNEAVALINAVLGNIIGVFISPALLQVYLPSSAFSSPAESPPPPLSWPSPSPLPPFSSSSPYNPTFPPSGSSDPPTPLMAPMESGSSGSTSYASVLKTLALTVVLPLVVGQLVLIFAERVVKWLQEHVNFGKVSNCCVLLIIWSTFCTSFHNQVTSDASSIVIVVVIQVTLFVLFTVMCLVLVRAPLMAKLFKADKSDAVAVAMCGATKTIALGMPIITTMFGSQANAGLLTLPLLVYHSSQILLGSAIIKPLRNWVNKDKVKELELEDVQVEAGRPVDGEAQGVPQATQQGDARN